MSKKLGKLQLTLVDVLTYRLILPFPLTYLFFFSQKFRDIVWYEVQTKKKFVAEQWKPNLSKEGRAEFRNSKKVAVSPPALGIPDFPGVLALFSPFLAQDSDQEENKA